MRRIEEKVNFLDWVLNKILNIIYYFKVALFEMPFLIIFLILICLGLYNGIKELFFRDLINVDSDNIKLENKLTKKRKLDYKRLIFSILFISFGTISFLYLKN